MVLGPISAHDVWDISIAFCGTALIPVKQVAEVTQGFHTDCSVCMKPEQ